MQITVKFRPTQSLAEVRLSPAESVVAESGALVGMSSNVAMQAEGAGFFGGLKRVFGGEAIARNVFTAQGGPGEVLLSTALSGDMTILDVGARQWCVESRAYVASAPSVRISPKGGRVRGFFSGAGAFVLETGGSGMLLIGGFGAIETIDVKGGLVIDQGHVVAWETSLVPMDEPVGRGLVATFLAAEGSTRTFRGAGQVFVQSRSPSSYGAAIGGLLPARSG